MELTARLHFRVIDSLPLMLGTDAATIRKFGTFRKKRNISDYERAGADSAEEGSEMSVLAQKLRGSGRLAGHNASRIETVADLKKIRSDRRMQINEVFKILDGRIRLIDNIGLMEERITTSGFKN